MANTDFPAANWAERLSGQPAKTPRDGKGHTPHLVLDAYDGPLDVLLELARSKAIDLRCLPILELLDQLVAALNEPTPLSQKGDWVVMAARLVLLRSQLMFRDEDADAQASTERSAAQLRDQLLTLDEVSTLANWLDRRPQLGRDIFARGNPGAFTDGGGDVVGFLWATLMVFERKASPVPVGEPGPIYRIVPLDLPSVPEARERIVRLLEGRGVMQLDWLLPDSTRNQVMSRPALRRRAEITSTFTASLELVKQGVLEVDQEAAFYPVQLSLVQSRQAAA